MSIKVIPRKTRVKMEFLKNVTLTDILLGFMVIASTIAIALSNFDYHLYVAIVWLGFWVTMFFPIADNVKLYVTLLYLFRFSAQARKYSKEKKKGVSAVENIMPFSGIVDNRFIDFKEYFAQVIEIHPIEFGLLNEMKQEYVVGAFANAIRRLSNEQTCSIVKVSKAMIFDNYVYMEDKKYDALIEQQLEGEMSKEEVEARAGIFEGRVSNIENFNRNEKVYKDYFYIVVYDKDKEALESAVDGMMSALRSSVTPVISHKLVGRDLAVFLRSNYGKEFDERELDGIPMSDYTTWAMPETIKFHANNFEVNGNTYRTFLINDYPLNVANAWGAPIFTLDRTKIVVKFKPIPKYEAEKKIDKAIIETESHIGHSAKSSKQIENETQLQTLKDLLASLKNNNQQLFDVDIYLTCEDSTRKEVRAILKQEGFKFTELFGRQVDGFISSNISRIDTIKEGIRGIPTETLAAIFPFISNALQDENGFHIGENEYPVFVDFFARNTERVNSNMMIIGKSGSGKSYATKTLLTNFAADNTKIFILDPENEYTDMAIRLKGKVIDVGSSSMGIINPFHVMTSLKADEEENNDDDDEFDEPKKRDVLAEARSKIDDSFALHLQFLEQFFRVILSGMGADAFEALNSIIVDVYKQKGIDERSNFSKLTAMDYPIFDDIYSYVQKQLETEKNPYMLSNLRVIETYIKKFASGGRNSSLWNGPTSIKTNENFISFNFQSLIANNNQVIANAQMLIIFKYLNNEVIKNKDFNHKHKTSRKIIVAVDEAHVFINPDYPVALDFMAQMAKRIRKYNGMQIVITQNIKDFVGSPEIQRQSTAVINASQYSLIFALAPNDMTDLVELYRKSGEINENEQNSIVTAEVGQCFFITGPTSRTTVKIEANQQVKQIFS